MTSIVTNVGAINAQRNLNATSLRMGKVLEKLSSGYRINRAADDAAGLGISEKMRSQIRGNQQALRNAQDGISMIQTAEGAMDEIHSILQRARELAVQAANGTMDAAARTSIGTELVQLQQEIDRIAQATQFNGQQLLNGTLTGKLADTSPFKPGVVLNDGSGDIATVSRVDVSGAQADTYTLTANGANLTIENGAGVQETVTLSGLAANGSAVINFASMGIKIEVVAHGAAVNADDLAAALAGAGDIEVEGSGAAVFQVGANVGNTMSVAFEDVSAVSGLGLQPWTDATTVVGSLAAANDVIAQVDQAIARLNERRSNLGAVQNRLEHTIASLGVAVENLTASESRIRDADIAQLSSQLVSSQILQQAGVAVLAQANQSAQAVLSLLR